MSRAELARHARDGLRLHDALGADAQRIELAAAHVAHDEEAQHLLEVVRARIDLVVLDRRRAHARARASVRAAAASMPPVSTVTVMTGRR